MVLLKVVCQQGTMVSMLINKNTNAWDVVELSTCYNKKWLGSSSVFLNTFLKSHNIIYTTDNITTEWEVEIRSILLCKE